MINVSQAFHRTSANPVDESMALTKAQMLTVNDNLMPAYYFTICQDDGEIYLYDKTATPSSTTGKFTKFEGGGGGGSTEGVVITKTLLASGWNSTTKQQTLTFNGYDADMGGVVGMPTNATSAQKQAYAEALIDVASQNGNVFTFQCEEIPSVDLPVTLYAGGAGGSGSGVPAGGTMGQALVKKSNTDGDVEWKDVGGKAFIVTVTMDSGTSNLVADKTPKELEDAIAANAIVKAELPMYGLTLDLSINAGGNFAFSTFYTEDATDVSTTAFGTILMVKDTDSTWDSITMQTLQGDKFRREVGCGTNLLEQPTIYLNDFDHVEKVADNEDVVSPHRLTASEMADIMSTLPGAPTQYPKYSTTEQVVGEWIDGKPLYQKTTIFDSEKTLATGSNWQTLDSASDMAKILDFQLYRNVGLFNVAQITISSGNINIARGDQTINNTIDGIMGYTVQYTKTTDD